MRAAFVRQAGVPLSLAGRPHVRQLAPRARWHLVVSPGYHEVDDLATGNLMLLAERCQQLKGILREANQEPEDTMLTLTDLPEPRFENLLQGGLADYNETRTHRRDWRALAIEAHDPDSGALAGGLLGRTSLGLFFLDLFYLPKHLRGTGMGSEMLRMAEAEAINRDCRAATLVTVNFQAPGFYARHGWEEFGRIHSAPDVVRIFMRKTLAA